MHPLERLDVSSRVAKRAQYEAFEFTISDDGVRVRNCSHADPSEHEYLVRIDGGLPTQCVCPADERFNGACKHRVAVSIRDPVLNAVVAASVAADGGTTTEMQRCAEEGEEDDEDCGCADLRGEFPCWECVRTGRRALPE